MAKLLIDPLLILLVLILAAFLVRRKIYLKKGLLIAAGVWLFIIYFSPIPYIFAENWERKYPPFNLADHEVVKNENIHIVILGAGFTDDPELTETSKLGRSVSMRLMEGVRIYNLLESPHFVTSGAGRRRSQAEAVAEAALALGVLPGDTLHLSTTVNTEDEAKKYRERFLKSIQSYNHSIILVTSAVHMRRAVLWFKRYGVDVIPAPCDYLFKEDPEDRRFGWFPSMRKIRVMDAVMEEWAGMIFAKVF
jgi:uncharacterized SAM-binding protein YcdF (DUF218 family)